jgi:hypothetical protein
VRGKRARSDCHPALPLLPPLSFERILSQVLKDLDYF